jgi:hypothetical protein
MKRSEFRKMSDNIRRNELKAKGYCCLFHDFASDMDSYDFILK